MKMLRAHAQLPIHGHRNGWGMLGRSPAIGMSYLAFQKLWRLAGIDHSHVNGIDNKFCETNESVIASARERSEERRVGKSVSVRVDLGGRRIIKKKNETIR